MLKRLLKGLAKRCGYEIRGYPWAYAGQKTLAGLLRQEGVNLVIDVGANEGQFAKDLLQWGYKGRILSFEPQASVYERLKKAAASHANWTVAERAALGAETGTIEMNISENTVSSSLLAMLPSHSEGAPESKYVATESVPVKRLDDILTLTAGDRVFLKIDVQGYEEPVLAGAAKTLEACRGLMVEMSLVPLYDGQILAKDLWNLLETKGFEPWALEPGFRSSASERMLQLDGLFVRKER